MGTTENEFSLGILTPTLDAAAIPLLLDVLEKKKYNDSGARLIDLYEQNNLKIANGFFQHKEIYKFKWTQKKLEI